MEAIKPGLTGRATMVVGTNDTAPRVGSGRIAVLATPMMINLIEEAALDAIEQHLPDGMQSLVPISTSRTSPPRQSVWP